MGWFGGSPSKVSSVSEVPEKKEPVFLEDLPPKFEDKESNHHDEATYLAALNKVSISDFTLSNYVTMPCFREAMLTGFSAMGVLGVVTLLVHKNPSRSVNIGIGGFFLGSVVGFEQCRSIRRRSFQNVEKAKQANQARMQGKIDDRQENDDALEKFNETQRR
ncbi:hypothetical protein FT663_00035 [Candidozyma haemuli var. vulneris]|uniref:Cytochrome c oxidase assembly protein COX20, mitochondrial n=1 Tax=Candidozyma haemuli TaxID=45357 RepID=A0A2V1AVM1_9ASCO|nr:hypothetical protein CXQ85_000824 [[Candida] haemuloni]KAF3994015.1 hypothetical protein FT662_00201 [[Candida] haemuloni var. vulneris]KAF3995812.1 hypothetical protein FT663_00035 [[Candida] haemuloni var. vulneris]PVH21832.1 hypothetical protein CXQ85_000824 [[Candida] haemuloni]